MVHCLWQRFSHCPNSTQTNSILFLTCPDFWTSMFFPHCPILARILLSQLKQNCPPQAPHQTLNIWSPSRPDHVHYHPAPPGWSFWPAFSKDPVRPFKPEPSYPGYFLSEILHPLIPILLLSYKFPPTPAVFRAASVSHTKTPLKWSLHQQPWPLPWIKIYCALMKVTK